MWLTVFRRTAVGLAAVVTLVVLFVAALHLPFARTRVFDWVRSRVSADFGIDIAAGALRYNLLGIAIELDKASFSAHGDPPFLEADLIRVAVSRRALLGTFDVTSLEVVRPHLTLVRHEDGTTNLPISQADQPTSSPVHLGIVSVSQLTVDARDEAAGHRASLGPVDVTVDTRRAPALTSPFGPSQISVLVAGGPGGTTRSLAGQLGGRVGFDGTRVTLNEVRLDTAEGQVTIDGWVDAIAETVNGELRGHVDADLARAARLIGPDAESLGGAATMDVALRGAVADPTVNLVISTRALRYQNFRNASARVDATYAGGRLDIARLDVNSEIGEASANGSLQVTASNARSNNQLRARFSNVDVDRLLDAVGVRRPIRIGSTVDGDVDVASTGSALSAEDWWQDNRGTAALRLTATRTGVGVGGHLNATVNNGRWTLDHLLQTPAGPASVAGVISGLASKAADGVVASTLSGQSRLRVERLQPLMPYLRQAGVELPDQLEDLDGVVDAVIDPAGTIAAPRARVTIAGRGLHLPESPVGQLDTRIAVNSTHLTIDSLHADAGAASVTASGSYTWAGRIDATFDATSKDLHALAGLAAADEIPVSGSARLQGQVTGNARSPVVRSELTTDALDAYDVAVGAINAQLRLANDRVEISAAAPALNAQFEGTIDVREPYRFEAEATLTASSIPSLLPAPMRDQLAADGTVTSTIRGRGNIAQLWNTAADVNLRALNLRIAGTPLVLDAPATITVQQDALSASQLSLRVGANTGVQLQGSLGLDDVRDGVNVHVEGPLTDVLAIAAPALPDVVIQAQQSNVALDLHIGGTLRAPQPTGKASFTAASLRYADEPPLTDVAIDAQVEPARIVVQSMAATALGARVQGNGLVPLRLLVPERSNRQGATGIAAWGSNWFGSLPPEPESATVQARVTGLTTEALAPFVDPSTLQQISGSVDATLTADADRFTLDRVRSLLVLDRASLVAAGVPFEQSAPTRIRLANGRAQIEEFRWHAESNEVTVSGGADLAGADRPVDVAVNGDVDLRVLGAFVSGVAAGGIAHSAMTVKGPLAAPDIQGTIAVSAGELRLDSPRVSASDIEGTIVVPASREATIALTGTVNGGSATVQGLVSLKDITAPTGRVTLSARNVALDYPEGLQTESNADLVLALAGPQSVLSGQLSVLSGLYREPLVVSRSLRSGLGAQGSVSTEDQSSFVSTLALDIKVATAEQIRVDNNYGRLNLTGNVQVTGTPLQPGAIGRVEAEPGGVIYLGGNTYRIESLVIDLTNPRAIAPDLSFLADTRIGNVPIEIALQCSASGSCEKDIRSQATGVTNEQAEAMLFGLSADANVAEAGTQLAQLLAGEVLGVVGQAVRLDTLRLEQASGRADLFDDPTLIAGDVNPASRLTLGKRIGEHVELAYSQNLADNGFTMTSEYFGPAGISARALLFDNQNRTYEFRHEPRFGSARRQRPVAVEGPTVASVRWTGELGYPENELRRRLKMGVGDRFSFAAWQADRERLISFYADRGFYEARVRARRMLTSGAAIESATSESVDTIALEYAIDRGQPTSLDVSGFNLPGDVRQRIITRWPSALSDGFLERDAVLIAREYLITQDRPEATVAATVQRSPERKTLHLAVDAGRRTSLRLTFEGNAEIPTATLSAAADRAGIHTAWLDPAGFAAVIRRLYDDAGFLSATVDVHAPVRDETASVVRVIVGEGPAWLLGRVTVDGAGVVDTRAPGEVMGLVSSSRYVPSGVRAGAANLEQRLRDAGFLNAHVNAETRPDPSTQHVDVHVAANPGMRSVLSSVDVEGSSGTQAAVARNVSLRIGDPVGASDLSSVRQALYKTGDYRSVEIDLQPASAGNAPDTTAETGDRPVVARMRVEERPRNSFRYGLAMNDDVAGPDQRVQKLGFAADFENRGGLAQGASVGLSARIRSDQEVGRAFLTLPQFFGLPVRSNVFLSRGRQQETRTDSDLATTTTTDVTEVSGEQAIRVRRLVDVRYGYLLGRNRTTLELGDTPPTEFNVRVARLTTSGLIDRRNDPFDASRGWFSSTTFELSRPGLGSDISFMKTYIQQFQFLPVAHRITIASALRLGLARTFRDETLIPSERFFGGGSTSVRGYRDNDLGPRSIFGDAAGGSALLIGNGELRFPIHRWLKGVAFADLGNVYPTVTDISRTGLQFGAGAGVRAATPVGLLRFDLAAPLNPRPFDPAWTVHFGLGHAF